MSVAAREMRVARQQLGHPRSVYDPLRRKLESMQGPDVRLTFSEIEVILGRPLPASAYRFSAWWGNEIARKAGHTQSRAWLHAGFEAEVSPDCEERSNFIEPEGSLADISRALPGTRFGGNSYLPGQNRSAREFV